MRRKANREAAVPLAQDEPTPEGALKEYREKRDFSRTAEPSGGLAPERDGRPLYCVQKHAASSLHYDLRLESEGVLKSWAVPKGPSLDPVDKRLAVRVEDHPLEYGSFEGTIPEGEYGAGTVIVWDSGWWEPDLSSGASGGKAAGDGPATGGTGAAGASPAESLARGELKLILHGQKLRGSWVLVQMKGRGIKNWLLLKHKDEEARPGSDITAERPESVSSGRTIEQVRDQGGGGHP
jgi:bifunctional non-homologous end joining protein LigD